MDASVKVGIVGCGTISEAYVKGCRKFEILDLDACADIEYSRAEALAEQHDLRACTVDELYDDPDIQIIINLTIPSAHAEVTLAAISAGKHVYSEKPLAVTREDGRRILAAAEERGVRVGCAPDTFLGGGLQTCRKLIDDGWIGEPVGAAAFMLNAGPESWHSNPAFFYQEGAGPLFDMGPYYFTALVHLLGPVQRVTGATRISHPERIATSRARFGERIPVQTPTYTAGVLNFAAGPVGTTVITFDVESSMLPHMEIHGSQGTLLVPDPNTFGGPVRIRRREADEWSDIPLTHTSDVRRGIGVADMAHALVTGRPHRANAQLATHILDIMHAIDDASETNRHIYIESECERPAPLPLDLLFGRLD